MSLQPGAPSEFAARSSWAEACWLPGLQIRTQRACRWLLLLYHQHKFHCCCFVLGGRQTGSGLRERMSSATLRGAHTRCLASPPAAQPLCSACLCACARPHSLVFACNSVFSSPHSFSCTPSAPPPGRLPKAPPCSRRGHCPRPSLAPFPLAPHCPCTPTRLTPPCLCGLPRHLGPHPADPAPKAPAHMCSTAQRHGCQVVCTLPAPQPQASRPSKRRWLMWLLVFPSPHRALTGHTKLPVCCHAPHVPSTSLECLNAFADAHIPTVFLLP